MTGLSGFNLIGFVPISDVDRSVAFYRDKLGLRFVSDESPFAVVFEANGLMLRLGLGSQQKPAGGTILGWQVRDISAVVQQLSQAGVVFERYNFLQQDEFGVWTTPTGAKVAWFKDPDGNVLSVSEHPEWV